MIGDRVRHFFPLIVGILFAACAHRIPEASPSLEAGRAPAAQAFSAADPALRKGDLTVWKLKEMAENKEFAALEDLFNNGVSLDRLPVGYAAGAGARVLNFQTRLMTNAIDSLTGKNWRGKIFFNSKDPAKSHGLNRIKKSLLFETAPIVPMAAFTTELLDRHELAPKATSNLVILNYAHPKTQSYWQEIALTTIQVYDVMVAVPGKYGPLYIGKTWLGTYDSKGDFRAFDPNKLVAWYFLDFNPEALSEQRRSHWDKSGETPIAF